MVCVSGLCCWVSLQGEVMLHQGIAVDGAGGVYVCLFVCVSRRAALFCSLKCEVCVLGRRGVKKKLADRFMFVVFEAHTHSHTHTHTHTRTHTHTHTQLLLALVLCICLSFLCASRCLFSLHLTFFFVWKNPSLFSLLPSTWTGVCIVWKGEEKITRDQRVADQTEWRSRAGKGWESQVRS